MASFLARLCPAATDAALREEVARLTKENAKLTKQLREFQEDEGNEGSHAASLVLSQSMRSMSKPTIPSLPPPPTIPSSTRGGRRDLGEEQAKLLEAYDKVSMVGEAMRMTKASEVAWKDRAFMPLAYRLRNTAIPRVTYKALTDAMDAYPSPAALDIEHGTDKRYKEWGQEDPIFPKYDDMMPHFINPASEAYWGVEWCKVSAPLRRQRPNRIERPGT